MRRLNIKKVLLVSIISVMIVGLGYFGIRTLLSNDNQTETKKPDTSNQQKTKNEFSHLGYYRDENLDAYTSYKSKNSDMSVEDIVTHVNMGIDKPFYSEDPMVVSNPDALDVVINKVYSLPEGWEPKDLVSVDNGGQQLRSEAAEAYEDLKETCADKGFTIKVHSGYRSVSYQKQIYDNMVSQYGEEYTDQYSSRPGQSEHNTGLCADISINGIHYSEIENDSHYETFKNLLEEYGFIIRYPDGKETLTGYSYESWHIRYLGKDLAKKVNDTNITYDEYVARKEK